MTNLTRNKIITNYVIVLAIMINDPSIIGLNNKLLIVDAPPEKSETRHI